MIDISLFRAIANQYKHIRSVKTVLVRRTISHLTEDQIIKYRLPVDIHTEVQKVSIFSEQMRRYEHFGTIGHRVYVYGASDDSPPSIPGVAFIKISPSSELSKGRIFNPLWPVD